MPKHIISKLAFSSADEAALSYLYIPIIFCNSS